VRLGARIRNSQDFWAGVLFAAIGIVTVAAAVDYPLGTLRNIGPGYFPVVLGVILALVGIAIAIRGIAIEGERAEGLAIRPLIMVTLSVVAFAFLLRPFGLVLATVALVAISALAGRDFSMLRVALVSAGLTVLSAGIFIYALRLPFTIGPP
jgi:hypothetical protein